VNGHAVLGILAAVLAVAGIHVLLAVAAVVIVVILAALGLSIAILVAECGWGVQPCRRRFAW
jgi:hypothetical protein